MEKLSKKICKSNTTGVFEESSQCNASKAMVGRPLHFVYDIVGTETKFHHLKYILDAAQPPLQDGPNFEKVYGVTRNLTFDRASKRRIEDVVIFESVY